MIKKTIKFILVNALFTSVFNYQALAETSKYKATIKKIKNKVEVKYEDDLWSEAKINQVITPITSIKTGDLSKVEILLSDGTVTRVGSNTSFTFLNKQNRSIKVQLGKLWFDVKKDSYGLNIYSPDAVAVITGTEGFIEFSGTVSQEDEIYIVKSGDTLTKIAKKFINNKTSVSERNKFIEKILQLNPIIIKNKNLVYEGNKIILNKTTNIKVEKKDNYFALGLIEGSSDVFKSSKNGEAVGNAKKVKEGELLTLKGGNFTVQNIYDTLKVPKDMAVVRGGTFQMGGDGESDEKPIHKVNIRSFYIGKNEVTQLDYKAVTGTNPSNFIGNNLPVENVSWWDAIKYCNKKSIAEKLPISYNESTGDLLDAEGKITKDITRVEGYRLPTEAEWEYAARGADKSAGYLYSGSNSIDGVAWYGYEKSGKTTHPVGSKAANEIGIFDMSGNVSEWVADAYLSDTYKITNKNENPYFAANKPEDFRVYRGGSWDYIERYQRVFTRSGYIPTYKSENIGFRIAKNISF